MLTPSLHDSVVAEHIVSRYGDALDVDHVEHTAERRFRAVREDGTNVVINAYIVGPNNAGAYRHWLAMPRPAWGRVFGDKPAGWLYYILMVGLLPDGATIWWSTMYDENGLAQSGLEPDYPRAGYGRLAPSLVKDYLVKPPIDEVQTEMFPVEPQCYHGNIRTLGHGDGSVTYNCRDCGNDLLVTVA